MLAVSAAMSGAAHEQQQHHQGGGGEIDAAALDLLWGGEGGMLPPLSSADDAGISVAAANAAALARGKRPVAPLSSEGSLLRDVAAIGITILPYLTNWWTLLAGLGIFSIGSSLTRPPVFGMISMLTPAHEQGATLGVAQGVGSLARIVGPLFAGSLFARKAWNAPLPYWICGVLCLLTAIVTIQYLTHVKPASSPPAG